MAKWKKTSSEKIADVITSKIKNPDNSLRDIQKETWVNYKTARDIINNEMEEVVTSCNKTQNLVNVNLSILEEWKKIIEQEIKKIWKGEWEVKIKSVSDIRTLSATLEDSFKQNQLLTWGKTEDININSKDIDTKPLEELKDWIQKLLNK